MRLGTTVPRIRDGGESKASGPPVLWWVHPAERLCPLAQLEGGPLVLGRGGTSDGCLDSHHVSREHARLRKDGPLLIVEDLGSTNGTFVSGVRRDRAPLAVGSVVRLGDWVGIIVPGALVGGQVVAEVAPGMLGGSKLNEALEPARRAATSSLPIIIEGATGTGKECVALAVHAWSGRSGPFCAMNCAAVPEHLAEAELFGYRRGAFTGADRASPGRVRAAHGGTLLLDEFTELSLPVQAKLLRMLERDEVTPLGDAHPVPVDVRLVVAAQEPLRHALATERLRPDLYARLDGVTVQLPPLRERIEEAPVLFMHFAREFAAGYLPTIQAELVESLCLYDWPLNVREVKLLAQRLLVLHGHEPMLCQRHLPDRMRHVHDSPTGAPPESTNHSDQSAPLPRLERIPGETREQRDTREIDALVRALRHFDGNMRRSCEAIGLSRQRAYRLMRRRQVSQDQNGLVDEADDGKDAND